MSWISPELIEILLTILKAVVILLVVVTCGAFIPRCCWPLRLCQSVRVGWLPT